MKPIPLCDAAHMMGYDQISKGLVTGVAIDSRKMQQGDLFFALRGMRVDGHTFLEEAAIKKAAGAVVEKDYQGSVFGLPLIRVPNVLLALQELARKSLQKRSTLVAAITGSLGKTTTKEFAKELIGAYYHTFASPESYNSQATVPLTVLMADEAEKVLILEMAMSEPGQIQKLTHIAPPDIAVLTSVALQHVAAFPNGLEGIRAEKASIFSHSKTKLGIVHKESYGFEKTILTGECAKISFSIKDESSDYFLKIESDQVHFFVDGSPCVSIPIQFPMKPHYQNYLAAVSLARALDVPWSVIQERTACLKLPKMRFEQVMRGGILFINDAYNANPDAMEAALEAIPRPVTGGKKIAVLGEMNALGTYSEEGHARVFKCALSHADVLLFLGEKFSSLCTGCNKHVEHFSSRSGLEERLKQITSPGDVVLLKGSRALALEEILKCFY